MKNKLIAVLILAAFAASCGRSGARSDQQNYEIVQEGSATGVTSTIHGPGETVPPITNTNVDTTTAFTIDPNAVPPVTTTQPGSIAGTLPPPVPSQPGTIAPPSPMPPSPTPRPRPVTPPPQPAPPPTQTEPPPEPEPEPVEPPPPTQTQTDTAPPPTQTDTQEPPPPPPPFQSGGFAAALR